eukprot:Awhi_evm1s2268
MTEENSMEEKFTIPELLVMVPKLATLIEDGSVDPLLEAIERRKKRLQFIKLPDKIVLLRHGQSEGNVDSTVYSSKGDSLLELTEHGHQQALAAGSRLKELVPKEARVFVAVSPFERAIQTLYALYEGGFPRSQVDALHHDPRIREQEFGNFQSIGLDASAREQAKRVGRFYFRRPNAESSADVFDRVTSFWNDLLHDGPTSLLLGRDKKYDFCLVVTHGLTIRLLLMTVFQWSVDTFETVFNLRNCHHITLKKNMDKLCYEFCVEGSYPDRIPWATRNVWIKFKDKKKTEEDSSLENKLSELSSEYKNNLEMVKTLDTIRSENHNKTVLPFTVLDYLTITPPRSMQTEEIAKRIISGLGHTHRGSPEELMKLAESQAVDPSSIEMLDWWGSNKSYRGRMLRAKMDKKKLTSVSLDTTPGGRSRVVT